MTIQHWTKFTCNECGNSLEVDDNGKKTRKGNVCRSCHIKDVDRRRREKRTAAVESLGNKCMDCGEVYPEVCYDFHHIGDKTDDVSVMIRNNKKLETILEEVSKCVLLCANCHRLRHFR